ncbi:DUF1643 domain-containing protein [Rossellomorea sp. BNER]|uniref:DUF1643 domain-containing protein n=1 Tax=Rossellomorea sp. BNER TaxID=2962031 RepID=UPI003AF29D1C|nr:DUF1643 domain-containing protein [Rossellomorea sp. BNER]
MKLKRETGKIRSSAIFDRSKKGFPYRYILRKVWNKNLPKATLIMLNPSIADEIKNDHTINRVINFLIKEGYGKLDVLNIFAYINTDSENLKARPEFVGPLNDRFIKKFTNKSSIVLIGWGSDKNYFNRKREVLHILKDKKLECFNDLSSRNKPIHPSVLAKEFWLEEYIPNF